MNLRPRTIVKWCRVVSNDESGQDAFEYVLTIAAVVVVVAVGLFAFAQVVPQVAESGCSSVNTAAADPDDCVNETP